MIRLPIEKMGREWNREMTEQKTLTHGFRLFELCSVGSFHRDSKPSCKGFSMGRTPSDSKALIRGRVEEKRSPRFKAYGCASLLRQAINRLIIIDDNRLSGSYNHYLINEAAERMMSKKTHTDNQKVEL